MKYSSSFWYSNTIQIVFPERVITRYSIRTDLIFEYIFGTRFVQKFGIRSNSGLRDPKFWYNSYIIVTLDVLNLWNQKCVSKKNWSMFFDAGVKNQKFKNGKMTPKTILYHAHTKNKKLLFSWPCLFRPLFKRYGCYRDFFEFFWNFFWEYPLEKIAFSKARY